jgi:hypothetical protein
MMPAPEFRIDQGAPPGGALSRPLVRWGLSGLLAVHLVALVVGPCSVAPSSQLCHGAWRLFRPYLDAAYLNHGYHFFAPEPGPSHLIRYEIESAGGGIEAGYFPDREIHRPRLLYHRYFMLSEHLGGIADDPEQQAILAAYSRAFARHLLQEHGAERVRLYLMRHLLPAADDVLKGKPLDDAPLYRERLLGDYRAGET